MSRPERVKAVSLAYLNRLKATIACLIGLQIGLGLGIASYIGNLSSARDQAEAALRARVAESCLVPKGAEARVIGWRDAGTRLARCTEVVATTQVIEK